jgi:hypothetical protein
LRTPLLPRDHEFEVGDLKTTATLLAWPRKALSAKFSEQACSVIATAAGYYIFFSEGKSAM